MNENDLRTVLHERGARSTGSVVPDLDMLLSGGAALRRRRRGVLAAVGSTALAVAAVVAGVVGLGVLADPSAGPTSVLPMAAVPPGGCDPLLRAGPGSADVARSDQLLLRTRFHGDGVRAASDVSFGFCAPTPEELRTGRAFAAFAAGAGPAPDFADVVRRWTDGRPRPTLSGSGATDPAAWGDASELETLGADLRRFEQAGPVGRVEVPALPPGRSRMFRPRRHRELRVPVSSGTPTAGVLGGARCRVQSLPEELAGRRPAFLAIGLDRPRSGAEQCDFVDVFTDEDGRIDAVSLRTQDGPG